LQILQLSPERGNQAGRNSASTKSALSLETALSHKAFALITHYGQLCDELPGAYKYHFEKTESGISFTPTILNKKQEFWVPSVWICAARLQTDPLLNFDEDREIS
jgi:hypothetical protein